MQAIKFENTYSFKLKSPTIRYRKIVFEDNSNYVFRGGQTSNNNGFPYTLPFNVA